MGIEAKSKGTQSETTEGNTEEVEYQLERFGIGVKAMAALDIGLLSYLKENWITSDAEWKEREKETGWGSWMLKNFGKKTFAGYQAMQKIAEVLDEDKFRGIEGWYEEKIASAVDEGEQETLRAEFKSIKRSRDQKIDKEKRDTEVISSVLRIIGDTLK